jgi:hypothetical protein
VGEPVEVRRAGPDDAGAVGRLLHDFNREYDEPTPPVAELAARCEELLRAEAMIVFLAGEPPLGRAARPTPAHGPSTSGSASPTAKARPTGRGCSSTSAASEAEVGRL